MIKLTDMQLVLLSTAAARDDGSLYPPAASLGTRGDRIRRSVAALIAKAFAAEAAVTDAARSWRGEGDQLFGVIITDAGRAAIAVTEPTHDAPGVQAAPEPEVVPLRPEDLAPSAASDVVEPVASTPRLASKIATVLDLLRREGGATLPELVAVTGWLPHTTRAALTGLRKKGHVLDKGSRHGATAYTITEVA